MASLLGIIEPVVTVVWAALVFGESLRVGQAVGAGAVLAAVRVVQWPTRVHDRGKRKNLPARGSADETELERAGVAL